MKIFVTGAAGFIGANLIQKLVEQGYFIRSLLHKSSLHPFLIELESEKRIETVHCSLMDVSSLKKAMTGCSVVLHLAAKVSYSKAEEKQMYVSNVQGTQNVLAAAHVIGIKKVVHVSSTAAIGGLRETGEIMNETVPFDEEKNTYYGKSKAAAEKEVQLAVQQGLFVVMVNPSLVLGSGDTKENSLPIFRSAVRKPLCFVPPGGTSIVTVEDVVSGILAALENGKNGERYILTGRNVSYQKLFSMIQAVYFTKKGKNVPKNVVISPLFCQMCSEIFSIIEWVGIKKRDLTAATLKIISGYKYMDNTKAQKELGWFPKNNFDTTIQNAIEFYGI